MYSFRKILIVLLLAGGLLWGGVRQPGAQVSEEPIFPDETFGEEQFPWPLPDTVHEIGPQGDHISESTVKEDSPSTAPEEGKPLVELPPAPEKPFVDAGDFRDPFFPVRGFQVDAPKVLQPGVTLDGIRFHSYGDTQKFVEKFYRESHFSLEDVFGRVDRPRGRQGCLYCHSGIEEISDHHAFACTKCHDGNPRAKTLPKAHRDLVANPSDLNHAAQYCGKCHADQIEKVKRSPMATAEGIINATRFAWGAQSRADPPISLRPQGKQEQPLPGVDGHPVDHFLRTKCLRCHLDSPSPHRPGEYRATGCAACHMVYSNDGLTMTQDRAIQWRQRKYSGENKDRMKRKVSVNTLKNRRGYPVLHKFTLAIPSVQCQHCHHNNGVGSEFEGLFGRPARPKPARNQVDAETPLLYGKEHEFLVPDIHRERGMHCIDCHGSNDIKGEPPSSLPHSNVETRCEDCHGTHQKAPKEFLLLESDPTSKPIFDWLKLNPNLVKKIGNGDPILVNSKGRPMPHIKREKKQWLLFSKVTGKRHVLPILKDIKPPAAHQVPAHMNQVECAACHARWSAGEWGLHVIRDPSPDWSQWRNWSFSDPTLQHLLFGPEESSPKPQMLDWLTAESTPRGIEGQWVPGVWWDIVTQSDWKTLILGKNPRGKFSIFKPRYQYFLTDRLGVAGELKKRAQLLANGDGDPALMMLPHTPHTIRKTTRPCESCHENPAGLGLGSPLKQTVRDAKKFLQEWKNRNRLLPEFQLKQMITESGTPLQSPYPGKITRFLTLKEINTLTIKTDSYRAYRYLDLRDQRLPRLLVRDEFPYDLQTLRKEKQMGPPPPVQNWYYDLDKNEILTESELEKRRQRFSDYPSAETPFQESFSEAPSPPEGQKRTQEGNTIIEFFQDLLKKEPPPDLKTTTPGQAEP